MENLVRLQKFLSEVGFCSRRKAEEFIVAGKITVNGKVAKLGEKVTSADKIFVNGEKISQKSNEKIYIMLHKPRGYITTLSDDYGRKTILDLLEGVDERVYPIGRLDKDSEGLLLLTNDGDFAQKVIHPRADIFKTYRVTVAGKVDENILDKLRNGVTIDGQKTRQAKIDIESQEANRTVLIFKIAEGKNRQIRKMCEGVGLEVKRLKRTHVGKLALGMLRVGTWREIDDKDRSKIF